MENDARPSLHSNRSVVGVIDPQLVARESVKNDLLQARTLGREFRMGGAPAAQSSHIVIFARAFGKIEKRQLTPCEDRADNPQRQWVGNARNRSPEMVEYFRTDRAQAFFLGSAAQAPHGRVWIVRHRI